MSDPCVSRRVGCCAGNSAYLRSPARKDEVVMLGSGLTRSFAVVCRHGAVFHIFVGFKHCAVVVLPCNVEFLLFKLGSYRNSAIRHINITIVLEVYGIAVISNNLIAL